jgi:hypothetical protein
VRGGNLSLHSVEAAQQCGHCGGPTVALSSAATVGLGGTLAACPFYAINYWDGNILFVHDGDVTDLRDRYGRGGKCHGGSCPTDNSILDTSGCPEGAVLTPHSVVRFEADDHNQGGSHGGPRSYSYSDPGGGWLICYA